MAAEKQQRNFLGKWDVFFIILVLLTLYYLFFINSDDLFKILGSLFISAIYLIVLWLKNRTVSLPNKEPTEITKIVLLTTDGEKDKEWYVKNAPSLLIGKNSHNDNVVDIDLADNHYAEYIDNEHAVINRIGGFLYLEDLDSANGVGIKRAGTSVNFKIKPGKAYKVDIDDIIYIAKVRLIVK